MAPNKEGLISAFVKSNFNLLKDKTFDNKLYDLVKREYFGKKLRLRYGIPKDREIAVNVLESIIKAQIITTEDQLEKIINETPFLKASNLYAGNFIHILKNVKSTMTLTKEIENLTHIEKINKLTEIAKKDSLKEIEALIEKKQQEYMNLPSILDDTVYVEPDLLPVKNEEREWWEELNLRENPFPGSLDGFSQIDKSLYKDIIVETQPIKWALNKITRAKTDLFHKGFLLGGEFGTGKTTFYDYMAPILTMDHIEPIRIAISDTISVSHYNQKYEKLICIEITKLAKKYQIKEFSRITDVEEARLVMDEIQRHGAKGFFLFIDDLPLLSG